MTDQSTTKRAIFSVKVLGTLALGAMLLTAVFLPTVNLSADEPSSPLTELQIFSTLDDDMAAPHKVEYL